MSTAVGLTAGYTPNVLSNTEKNRKREEKIAALRQDIDQANKDLAKANKKPIENRLKKRQAELEKISNEKPLYPAKGDAVKALNAAMQRGDIAWRLVTFKDG